LDVDYLDLYMVHWPGVEEVAKDPKDREEARAIRASTWQAMEEIYKSGASPYHHITIVNSNNSMTIATIRKGKGDRGQQLHHSTPQRVVQLCPRTALVKLCVCVVCVWLTLCALGR
jgi:aryl-alcohol dehydrogenase-like predicted oxidoreductase